jgi:hypothetical protein
MKSFPIGAQRGHDELQAFVGTVKRSAFVQMRSLWRFYEDHQMKTRTILIASLLASAAVSLSIIYGLWWLVGVL